MRSASSIGDSIFTSDTSQPLTYGYPLSGLNHPLLRSVKANFALLYDAVTNVSRPGGAGMALNPGERRRSSRHPQVAMWTGANLAPLH